MLIWGENVPKINITNVTKPKILMVLISLIFSTNFKFEQPPGHVFDRLPKTAPMGHVESTLHCVHTEHHR